MTTCSTCKRPILWTVTTLGRRMPLDPDPFDGGNVRYTGQIITDPGGRLVHEVEVVVAQTALFDAGPSTEDRYVSHFATCPQANHHRQARR